jgi:CRP/FNR family transcriptional regulator, cyclic AMP receptor protein
MARQPDAAVNRLLGPEEVISMIEVTATSLAAHPFLHGLALPQVQALSVVASDVTFPAGGRIVEDGGYASKFWLVRSGRVVLDKHLPDGGTVVIEAVGMGDLVGWSWLFPPYRWTCGAVAFGPVEAFEFDATAVRERCAADPELAHELTRRLARVISRRLTATQARLLARG